VWRPHSGINQGEWGFCRSARATRNCSCHLAERSPRPSWPSLTRRKPRVDFAAPLGFSRRSIGTTRFSDAGKFQED